MGASPYANGAYLVLVPGDSETHTLYCPCGKATFSGRWSESKRYVVSGTAYDRGYGSPAEILPTEKAKLEASSYPDPGAGEVSQ